MLVSPEGSLMNRVATTGEIAYAEVWIKARSVTLGMEGPKAP